MCLALRERIFHGWGAINDIVLSLMSTALPPHVGVQRVGLVRKILTGRPEKNLLFMSSNKILQNHLQWKDASLSGDYVKCVFQMKNQEVLLYRLMCLERFCIGVLAFTPLCLPFLPHPRCWPQNTANCQGGHRGVLLHRDFYSRLARQQRSLRWAHRIG